jgi:nitrite reductase/ring-hydroxylating ferredoxin subunit
MPQFHPALKTTEIAAGKGKSVVVQGVHVAVFNVAGKFHAISNTCPHRGGPLADGAVSGSVVTCPWHGFSFDCTNGGSADGRPFSIPAYKTRVENGFVEVEL